MNYIMFFIELECTFKERKKKMSKNIFNFFQEQRNNLEKQSALY
jgi:hypothetical protein